jgi:predicted nucleic acid-binding Zn ribbon protein
MADPNGIREVLLEFAARIGLEHPGETARLFSAWEEIVGDAVARRCEAVSLKGGVLTVAANTTAWAAELKYLAPEMIRRVNSDLGREVVTEVRVFVKRGSEGRSSRRHPGRRK